MTIRDARKQRLRAAAQLLVSEFDNRAGFGSRDVTRAVVDQVSAVRADQRAAKGDVFRLQRDTHRRRLDRTSPGIIPCRIVAEQRHIRGVAARIHLQRRDLNCADNSGLCERVEIWRARHFERSLAVQIGVRLVRRAVRHEQNVLHQRPRFGMLDGLVGVCAVS